MIVHDDAGNAHVSNTTLPTGRITKNKFYVESEGTFGIC